MKTYTGEQMQFSDERIAAGWTYLDNGATVTHARTTEENGNPVEKFYVGRPEGGVRSVHIYVDRMICSCESSLYRSALVPCKHVGAVLVRFPAFNPMHKIEAYQAVEVVA